MKTFTIFLMAAFAIVLATASPTWKQQQSSILDEDYNDHQNSRGHHNQQQTKDWFEINSNAGFADNGNQQQRHHHQQSHHQQQRYQSNYKNDEDDDASSDNWTDVQPFQTKITRRLEESGQLSSQPEIKRKILKLVDDKMNACKFTGAASKGKADRHCVGRATGQIMQLIAAFENGSRDLPGFYEF